MMDGVMITMKLSKRINLFRKVRQISYHIYRSSYSLISLMMTNEIYNIGHNSTQPVALQTGLQTHKARMFSKMKNQWHVFKDYLKRESALTAESYFSISGRRSFNTKEEEDN